MNVQDSLLIQFEYIFRDISDLNLSKTFKLFTRTELKIRMDYRLLTDFSNPDIRL